MYVDCTPLNIHTLIKASSPEKHTVQDTYKYSQSSSCDNSCQQTAVVVTRVVKPRLNCDFSSVMKSSLARKLLQVTLTSFLTNQLVVSFVFTFSKAITQSIAD